MTLVFASLVLALGGVFAVMVLRQNGRMLIRLEALERELVVWRLQISPVPNTSRPLDADPKTHRELSLTNSRINRNGLPMGAIAPTFSLPRVDGAGSVSLAGYAGRPVLLVFAAPDCGPCDSALRRLAQLPRDTAAENIVVVGRGSREANVAKLKDCPAPFPVVLQQGWEISRAYGTFTLPSACLVSASGTVSSELAVGPDAIVAMAQVLCEVVQSPPSVVRQVV